MTRRGQNSRSNGKLSNATMLLMKDEELVVYVRKGNPEGYQILVDRYDILVRSIVMKYLGRDTMLVEDACQETFLKALAKISKLRNPSRFKSWLCAIANNQALDTIRRRQRIVSWNSTGSTGINDSGETQVMWQIPDTKGSPADIHAKIEVAGVVNDILSDIPDLYQVPIKLRFEQDLDYQQIADLLDKPLGTIKSLIHRGKAIIREELTRRAGSDDGALVLAS